VLTRWPRARAAPVIVAGRRWRLVIAVDGKVERGARLCDGRQVHLLSAYDTAAGIVLAQVPAAARSNELFRPRAAFRKSENRAGWPGRRRGILVRESPRMSLARGLGAGALDCCR
jgi:hypothetical protein